MVRVEEPLPVALGQNAGMIVKPSTASFVEATSALVEAIERRGLTVFARIDHAAAARRVGATGSW